MSTTPTTSAQIDIFSGPRIFTQHPVALSSTTLNVEQGEWLTPSATEPGKWERVGAAGADTAFPNIIPTGRPDASAEPDGSGTLTIPFGVFMARTTHFDPAVITPALAPGTRLRAKLVAGKAVLALAGGAAANAVLLEPPAASNDDMAVFMNVLPS